MNSMPPSHGPSYYNQPPPHMGWRGPPGGPQGGPTGGPSPFRGPPPSLMGGPPQHRHQHEDWRMDNMNQGGKPRPLMDIPTYAPPSSSDRDDINPNTIDTSSMDPDHLEEEVMNAEKKVTTLQGQISQSEQNLAAQKKVTDDQMKNLTEEAIRKAQREHLELLSHDEGVSLDEFDVVLQPIIESCTKETISGGKVWIFQNAISRDTNRLIAQYLAFKVTDPSASFQLKLHIIYLMNDVLHHCMRKNNDDLRSNLETVGVDMFCSAWISSTTESDSVSRQGKLTKLIKLWLSLIHI